MAQRNGRLRWPIASVAAVVLLAGSAWIAWRTWPRTLNAVPRVLLPRVAVAGGRVALKSPSGLLVARISSIPDELTAYLEFEYFKSLPRVDPASVLLAAVETEPGPEYRIYLRMEPDLLGALPALAELESMGFVQGYTCEFVERRVLADLTDQTRFFVAAYSLPVRRGLSLLPPQQVLPAVARFMLFKSRTDRRVRERIEPVPTPLSINQARRLAGDVIAVARFYSLPLDFFLGIGAMENNYMVMLGDLEHKVWKRRAQPGDVVLARRRGRVQVLNYSVGVWQITRETLRRAHEFYLKDTRDYSLLPERLRPAQRLDLDAVTDDMLTTYSGLLFRSLLDRFYGDIRQAVAAYNGGVDHPNEHYADGVTKVAAYARRIVEQTAALDGHAAAETQFLTVRRSAPVGPETRP